MKKYLWVIAIVAVILIIAVTLQNVNMNDLFMDIHG